MCTDRARSSIARHRVGGGERQSKGGAAAVGTSTLLVGELLGLFLRPGEAQQFSSGWKASAGRMAGAENNSELESAIPDPTRSGFSTSLTHAQPRLSGSSGRLFAPSGIPIASECSACRWLVGSFDGWKEERNGSACLPTLPKRAPLDTYEEHPGRAVAVCFAATCDVPFRWRLGKRRRRPRRTKA